MSTAATTSDTPVRKALPAEVSNVLTAYWIGVSLVLLTLVVAFFMLVDAGRAPFADSEKGGASTFGWILLVVAATAVLVLASIVANGFAEGRPVAFGWLRIAVFVGVGIVVASLALAVLLGSGGSRTLLGPEGFPTILSILLLMFVAFLPFLFLIMSLSLSRGDDVRAFFWPEQPAEEAQYETEEEGGVAVAEEPEDETWSRQPSSGVAIGSGEVQATAEYRPEDAEDFAATQEMSPPAQGLIYVDEEMAGSSVVTGPESSNTRRLEAMLDDETGAEQTPEGSDLGHDELVRRDAVEQAEAEPPDSIHDESFTPSEPILLPESGHERRPRQTAQPTSEADERLAGSDPIVMVPEQGPPRKLTMFAEGSEVFEATASEPVIGEGASEPVIGETAAASEPVIGEAASEPVIGEAASEAVVQVPKKKKDTGIAPGSPPPPKKKKSEPGK